MKSDKFIQRLIDEGFEMLKNKLKIYDENLNHRLKFETITLEDKRELIDKQIKKVQNSLSMKNQNPGFYGFNKEIAKYYRDKNGLYQYLKQNSKDQTLMRDCASIIFLAYWDYEKLRFLEKVYNSINAGETDSKLDAVLELETEILKDWILSDYLSEFGEIEKELFSRKFIDNNYKWKKTKRNLIEFLIVIQEYGFFKRVVQGNQKQGFHYRRFIAERYGYGKFGLSDSWKKHQPNLNEAKIPFFWINKPE